MIEIQDLSFHYSNQDMLLNHLNFKADHGDIVLINGKSGCGKSTLLNLIYGLLSTQNMTGSIHYDGNEIHHLNLEDRSKMIGYVFQDIDLQLVTNTVVSEIRFGLESQYDNETDIQQKVEEYLSLIGLNYRKQQSVASLSGGQKQKLIIASILALNPKVILMDEPFAQMDIESAQEMVSFIADIAKSKNILFIICEHRTHFFDGINIDRYTLVNGQLNSFIPYPEPYMSEEQIKSENNNPVLEIHDLSITLKSGYRVLDHLTASFREGERVAILGKNGSGKSTLFQAVANLMDYDGNIKVKGSLGLLFQNPDFMLTKFSVQDEIDSTKIRQSLDLNGLEDHHPLTLSKGQRLRVAFGQILSRTPNILILDEPTSGQDVSHINQILTAVNSLESALVICSSHDIEFIMAFATRIIILDMGKIVYDKSNHQQREDVLAYLSDHPGNKV